MNKNILTILICIIILYFVYLRINSNNLQNKIVPKKENFRLPKPNKKQEFNIQQFYKPDIQEPTKITKDNYDFDYETDFKYNDIPIIKEDFHSSGLVWKNNYLNMESQGSESRLNEKESTIKMMGSPNKYDESSPNWINTTMTGDPNFLVPNELESNGIYSMAFPENTSIELAQFNAENVTDLFKSNNMEDLYNNINADVYRGYKTLKYML